MPSEVSALERARRSYVPQVPEILRRGLAGLGVEDGPPTGALRDTEAIRERFPATFGGPIVRIVAGGGPAGLRPLRVGVVLSGGQAPGGHNVIAGLLDAILESGPDARLYGFLGGPRGIYTGRYEELGRTRVDPYRNTGGFDMIRSGRDKISTSEQLEACAEICAKLDLDGLVVVGGDDSNTNAAVLTEHFLGRGVRTRIVGVPKTIDGDLRGEHVETSFGFDTATKLYAELIGNISRDARSAAKYWHFIKLMGRNASHVTLECALATRPNVALIGEEVEERGQTLRGIVEQVADVVCRRALAGRSYGVCLVPEGLIEFIPEIRRLIAELNAVLSEHAYAFESLHAMREKEEFVEHRLTAESAAVFGNLPPRIRQQLLLDRDAHGNVQVSKIDTEQLIVEEVRQQVEYRRADGKFTGKFQVQPHFLGYEGRCAPPSNFDADYTYTLGRLAGVLIAFGRTGCICAVTGLVRPPGEWEALGVPLTSMMQMERRKGKDVPVIGKALVRLESPAFRRFAEARGDWELEDAYLYPGPIQYFGPPEVSAVPPIALRLDRAG